MRSVLIISGMFPPMHGGLPDHTDRLAWGMSAGGDVTVLTSRGVDTERPFRVFSEVENWHDAGALLELVRRRSGGGPILWQYVPHMYGRGGVNLAVPRVMAILRAEGRRQVVIAHEIRAPYSWWPHRFFYALSHRWMWRNVRKAADAVGVSTAGWLDVFRTEGVGEARGGRRGRREASLFLAPSPSNLDVVPVGEGHATGWRREQGLEGATAVMGFFGSVGTGKQFEWVLSAWRAVRAREGGAGVALVVVGGRPEPRLDEAERRFFRPLGYLGGEEASRALLAMDVLLLPFSDGISERRSSFMAGLAHGVVVVTTIGEGTGSELRAGDFFKGVPVEGGAAAFAAAAAEVMTDGETRVAMARRARETYAARYDWGRLTEGLWSRLRASE